MIFSLLTVGLLVAGVGANLTPVKKVEPQQELKQTNFNLNIQQNNATTTTTGVNFSFNNHTYWTDTSQYQNTTTYYWNRNYEGNATSNPYNIRANVYEGTQILLPDGIATAYFKLQNQFNEYNNTLFAFQLSPNNSITDNSLTINLNQTYNASGFIFQYAGQSTPKKVYMTLKYSILQTTNSYASRAIGANPTLSRTMIQDWYSDISNNNSVARTKYETAEYGQALLGNLNEQGSYYAYTGATSVNFPFTKNIEIDSRETNYILVKIQARYRIYDDNNQEIAPTEYIDAQVSPANSRVYSDFQNWLLLGNKYASYTATWQPTPNQEVVDIPGIMWEILTMPFAFVSTAFNLTLFPGTPYQLNVANLVLMLFGILVFIFIFKLILKR